MYLADAAAFDNLVKGWPYMSRVLINVPPIKWTLQSPEVAALKMKINDPNEESAYHWPNYNGKH